MKCSAIGVVAALLIALGPRRQLPWRPRCKRTVNIGGRRRDAGRSDSKTFPAPIVDRRRQPGRSSRYSPGGADGNGAQVALFERRQAADAWPTRPGANFFFRRRLWAGGRPAHRFGRECLPRRQINVYSWHPTTRGPQGVQGVRGRGMRALTSIRRLPGEANRRAPPGSIWAGRRPRAPRISPSAGNFAVSISDAAGGAMTPMPLFCLLIVFADGKQTIPFGQTFLQRD